MSVSIAQQVDLLYKQAFGVTKTDTANNKSPSNESIPSPLLMRGDTLWAQSDQIPALAAAVPNIVQAYTGVNAVQMTADNTTVPIGGIYPTWLTNLTYWIPQEFGATYNIKIYVDNPGAANPTITGTEIFAAGSGGTGEYYYNYQSGVLNFIGQTIPASLTSGKVLYAVGYRYIGKLGVTDLPSNLTIGNLNFNDTTISTISANGNLIFSPNGTGQVTTTASFTTSENVYANFGFFTNNVTANNFNANSNISANGNILGNFLLANANVVANIVYANTNVESAGNVISNNITANIDLFVGANANIGNGFAVFDSTAKQLNIGGNIVPSNTGYSLGNATNPWSGLYISGETIYIGNSTIKSNNTSNTLLFTSPEGAQVAISGNSTVSNLSTDNLTVNAQLSGNTANFSGNITTFNANLGNLAEANFVQTGVVLNGNSNISIQSNGNVGVSVAGLQNIVVVSSSGANFVGYVSANGDGTFGALKSNSLTATTGNLQLYSEQTGNSYIELKPFGNGTVDVANFRISSLAMPTAASDAATKQYVDDVAQGLNVHDSCYTATGNTLANLTGGGTITYNNGTAGVGANLVLSGSYTKDFTTANTFDGNTTAVANSRILVKNEVNAAYNGIYVVSNATVLTRADDYNTIPEVEAGDFVFIQSGNTYNDTGWVQTSVVVTIGTDPIEFTQFSGAGTYQAGQGLTLTGTVFSVNVDNVTTEISGGNVVIKANAQFTTPNIGAATGTSLDLTGNVLANNLNANNKVTSNIVEVTSNLTSNNITVNAALGGNTANFTGNVLLNNLSVNLELAGNTANFTSVNVNALSVANTANLGNVGNITILGGNNGQFLQTNGNGVLNWGTVDTSIIANGNSNVSIPSINGNVNISSAGVANVVVVTGTGANITGNLAISLETITNALSVNNNITGNTANFSGNVIVPNLTVNVELDGNTANFNSATILDFAASNTANLGNVGNITILGGSNGQFLQTDGTGNLTFGTVDTSIISNGTSNVSIPSANGNVLISVGGIANVVQIGSSNVTISNNLSVIDSVTAGNISANGNVTTTNLNANYIFANNEANFKGNVNANANLTVNLELSGNTANFSTSIQTPLIQNGNSNIGITANGNIILSSSGTANVLIISNAEANLTGNLFVSGNLEVTGNFDVNSLVSNNLTANNNLYVGNTTITWATTTTTAITANQTIAQVPVAGFIGVQFLVRGVDSSGAKYSVATVQAVTDGANIDYAVYGGVGIGGTTGILAVNIVGGNIALQVTPTTSNSTVWTTQYRLV